ncbi:hypothetical protein [Flavicella sp.]|uniref:hypothetical protein n=1 Tax=Flavicella sp. TaxID=2957742 RepID=UPI00301B3CFA
MIKIKNVVVLVLLFFGLNIFAQDSTVKWAIGIGGSFIDFSETSGFTEEAVNVQIPYLTMLRYIDYGFTVGAGITITGISEINNIYSNKYDVIMMDFFGKYDFGFYENKWVPQIIGGLGLLIKERNDRSISVNGGVGLTYWILPRMGLNSQIVHRFVSEKHESNFGSHTQFSGSLIFTFGESKGKRNKRRTGYGFTTY